MPKEIRIIGVVDDDHRVLSGLQQLLESVGYEVMPFRSARDLLTSNDLSRIECVITDIGMPEINGLELREILERRFPEKRVILITGRYELIENLPQKTGLKILKKPFDSAALLLAISEASSKN
ncbi:response regulator [Endobacterium cereale]|uniref:response regulator n=1 Tax=Endobacterium cereale TaxID=2663029 RepID=UPI002B49C329|nr:response regulator [Endobacterium cereale]MEB2848050.1 response regulator [Endobacterium cereale]